MSQSKNDQTTDFDLLEKEIKSRGNIPQHIAVIMDGNGRWAKKRHLPRVAGHRAGRHSVRRTVAACQRLGVETLTLYTFSQENWNRPATEVKALWLFLQEVLGSEIEELRQAGVRLTATGDLNMIPDKARTALNKAIDDLSAGDGLVLNLALAYGGRDEIVHAARRAAQRVADGELKPEDITEDVIAEGLFNPGLKDPDLVVRTSGEHRLSNFLIWQSAYAEMYFTPVLWPDFCERDLMQAVSDFQGRERRYGALAEKTETPKEGSTLFDVDRWKRLLKVRP